MRLINYLDKLPVHNFHLKLYFTPLKMKIPIPLNYKRHKGFTLLEMMIAIGIIILLAGISVGSYRRYQWSIDYRSALTELDGDIKRAQQVAITNPYPNPSGKPTTYRLESTTTGKEYSIKVYHDNAAVPVAQIKTVKLPNSVLLATTGTMIEFYQTGVPISGMTTTIALKSGNLNLIKNITVTSVGGVVKDKF